MDNDSIHSSNNKNHHIGDNPWTQEVHNHTGTAATRMSSNSNATLNRSNASSNIGAVGRNRRPSMTPKVKVPVALQSAITPEAQLRALAVRNAVRAEADDYIASLKRSIKS